MPRAPEPTALVVAPAATVRAAGPAARQALAAEVGAPWPVVSELAERGPVPILGDTVPRRARDAAERLRREHGLTLEVIEEGGLAWAGGAIAAAAAAAATLLAALAAGALVSWILAVVLAAVAVALLVVAAQARGRAGTEASAWATARSGARDLDARRAAAGEAWTRLTALRKASLDPQLPPVAQADLWSALDGLDARVVASPGDPVLLAELASALDAAAGRPTTGDVAEVFRDARAAAAELSRAEREP